MRVTETKEKYLVSIDGDRVKNGDVCLFRAKGLLCIGIFKGFGKRGAIVFSSILKDGNDFSLMPKGIDNLVVLKYMNEFLEGVDK